VPAPLAGTVYKIQVKQGQAVETGEVIMILEAMKMETEVRTPAGGVVSEVKVHEGDGVQVGDSLLVLV
jgi:oxaloacetate decarboxylase alpha subunit